MNFKTILLAIFLNILFMINAYAYIDPGVISIFFQAIVGAIVAGAITIKIYWHKLKNLFKKKEDKSN